MSFYSKTAHLATQNKAVFRQKCSFFHVVSEQKNDAHYFGYKHNVLYHKTLQLHTYFAHIFVRTILISK